ncbi:MAG TPA: chemotaxis protein CheA [Bacteroidales bacterium]|nr:MAG: hypothetical protein A2W98_07855 [Bacteroidetes bacterium GWF2_33_38]OFY74639.1 MAG: hypothetical protein A2265_01480 [Bacteroidetes bacterium RIFOXYA12_FULL_33_9]OFY92254.1 MAG: hypothetical protein A2236_09110 [Bacteroidetes bacterium RIFOXYA2_FULL_33_7]HBF87314.1 chemotaxis protein CheA [Bacteroidales bacterium]
MDNFIHKYLEEATELIINLEDALLVLENNPSDKDSIANVFRIMHTLKGNSSMFGFDVISDFTHHLENIYDLVRQGRISLTKDIFDVTLESVDHLRNLLKDTKLEDKNVKNFHDILIQKVKKINTDEAEQRTETVISTETLIKQENDTKSYYIYFKPFEDILLNGTNPFFLIEDLNDLGTCMAIPNHTIPNLSEIEPEKCYSYWHILLNTEEGIDSIKDIFIFVEDECELVIQEIPNVNIFNYEDGINKFKLLTSHSIQKIEISDLISKQEGKENEKLHIENDDKEVEVLVSPSEKIFKQKETSISSIRVSSEKIDEMMNLVSELITVQARLTLFAENNPSSELTNVAENIQKLSRQLRDNAFSISLIPLQSVVTRFQRLVRDLSTELNKDIEFVTEGTETELDKNIIEKLSDPIMHIIRNSLDHGIEDKNIRKEKGKPEKSKLLLKAYYSGVNVFIQISDDGAGLDVVKIRNKAISSGIIHEDTVLTEKELFDLIFLPGFSTASKVTEVSGRGVGMDVVKRKISEIRGEVSIDSVKNEGTSITIKLPLTLSIIDGLLVKIENEHFVIPLSGIFKCFAVGKDALLNAFNNTIVLDGEQVPTVNLRKEFGMIENIPETVQVVVVMYDSQKVGIAIDKVIGEYQAVLKPLGKIYKNQEFISGATILGDGTIALVLDPYKIIIEFDLKAKTI